MKLFGFELIGILDISVKCPSCGDVATILVVPKEKPHQIPIHLFKDKEIYNQLKKYFNDWELPMFDDLHFFCMFCWRRMTFCEKLNKPCKIGQSAEEALKNQMKSLKKVKLTK